MKNKENEISQQIKQHDFDRLENDPLEEVKRSLKKLHNINPTGYDSISAELLKNGGKKLEDYFHKLIGIIWVQKQIPK